MSVGKVRWPHLKQWALRLLQFGLVQGMVQVLSATAGLLIVRTLAKQDYALFAIVNSMQAAANILADVGISMGVRSIGGKVCDDPVRYGQLLNAAFALRRWFAIVSLTVTIPLTALMLWRNGASWPVACGLCLTIIASILPLLSSSVWVTSLQLHGQYRALQKVDLSNAVLRLSLVGGLAMVWLSSITAALTTAAGNWYKLLCVRKHAVQYADTTQLASKEDRREMIQLAKKLLPNSVFYCLQSQFSIWLISIFGNASHVAEVSALGRIALLFVVLNTTMDSVVTPRFARCQDPRLLLQRYFQVLAGCVVLSILLTGSAEIFSKQFLWLLGPGYSNLRAELLLTLLNTVTSFLITTMWGINTSRAWIKGARLYVPGTIAGQVISLMFLDLSTVRGVLLFGFWSLVPWLLLNVFMSWSGFRQMFKQTTIANS